MDFDFQVTEARVTLTPKRARGLGRLLARRNDLTSADPGDHDLLLALGDLAALEEELPGSVVVEAERIQLDHDAVARLPGTTAKALGLPPLPDLTLSTDVQGVVGNPDFRLTCRWTRDGRQEAVRRTGAILHTSRGDRRIPHALLKAIELSEAPTEADLPAQWNGLARFRGALLGSDTDEVGRIAMTDFLSGLNVHLASGFSMQPREGTGGLDFEIAAHETAGEELEQSAGDPDVVARRIRERGALPAYRLAAGSYLVVDEAARPVLDVMTRMQKAPPADRDAFVRNPLPLISEAVEQDLAARGKLDALDDADRQEAVERGVGAFVETSGYADRVAGIGRYEKPEIDFGSGSGVTWLPEVFGPDLSRHFEALPLARLRALRDEIADAVARGETAATINGSTVPIDRSAVAALDAVLAQREIQERSREEHEDDREGDAAEPVDPRQLILQPGENFEELTYASPIARRAATGPDGAPARLRTRLHPHQNEGLAWAQAAWRAGLPGILNADEQGLGKTLQTIAFLAWLKERLAEGDGPAQGPVLVVAPTSLLETWENEVRHHLDEPGLGTLVRLYGSGLQAFRRSNGSGRETTDAAERLDLSLIHEALQDGRAHRMWMLTTYQTLTNYQHSLGRIPFAALVFDEIQALKNPGTLAAKAAKAMNADFRIGLTGTPVENTVTDLWAIMDELVPGHLGTLKDFRATYETSEPDPDLLAELYGKVFSAQSGSPPIGLRRLKEQAASHLPEKVRFLYPCTMPELQAETYESARLALAGGGLGAALKMLHRIRGVSMHPDPEMTDGFEDASARLQATLRILDRVKADGERALVFIEDRRMQHRFIALARARYALTRIDVINGSTPIRKRQQIVDRFQDLGDTSRFALLVLGPRAAGTGLTLTAATHVIHLSRWWNPAVEEQCNDRVHRIGQDRPVSVHLPMAIHPRYGLGSFDCQLQMLMERKRRLARETLFPAGESVSDLSALTNGLVAEEAPTSHSMDAVMASLFSGMGRQMPAAGPDGAYKLE